MIHGIQKVNFSDAENYNKRFTATFLENAIANIVKASPLNI